MSTRGFVVCGCLVSVLCEFAGSRRLFGAAPGNSQLNNQAPQVATAGRSPATIIDKTPAELVQAMPESAGLEPAASQEILPEILENVGAKLESYFRNVVSTSAREETIQERIGLNGEVRETLKQTFRYLVIAHPEKGPLDFEEYRTDKENLTAGGHVRSDILLTEGFVYVPIYLHPIYQDDSDFNYVGQQTVGATSAMWSLSPRSPNWLALGRGLPKTSSLRDFAARNRLDRRVQLSDHPNVLGTAAGPNSGRHHPAEVR